MNNDIYAVEFDNVCKIYKLKNKSKKNADKNIDFYALKNITVKIKKGEIVGILGTNGSGKSTISSIIAGITSVDSGSVTINGEQSLISINTGLNTQLTGLENIKAKGALLGLSKQKIEDITQGVIEFAELGEFLYEPVKKYSSGMRSRLGFAISINLDPDIIIIDEALSVGDSTFANKCIKKMEEFKEKGKTIFFVSHSLSQVKSFCNKGLWIEGGELKIYDDIDIVSKEYTKYVKEIKSKTIEEKKNIREKSFENRIVRDLKSKKSFNKKRVCIIVALILLFFFCLMLLYKINNYRDSLLNSNNEQVLVENNKVEEKEYKYLFFIEGDSAEYYKNDYRTYIKDNNSSTISTILYLNLNSSGEINVTNIPISMQVYYDSIKMYDEIRFLKLFSDEKSFYEDIYNEIGGKVEEVYFVKKEELISAVKKIGVSLDIHNNSFEWEIDGEKYLVNNDDIDIDTDYKSVFEKILNKIYLLNKNEKNEFLKILTDGDFKSDVLENSDLSDNIKIQFNNVELKKVKLRDLFSDEEINLLDSSFSQILDKELLIKKEEDINENLYYIKLKDSLNELKNLSNDTSSDERNNSEDNNPIYIPNINGGSTSPSPGGSTDQSTGGSTDQSTGGSTDQSTGGSTDQSAGGSTDQSTGGSTSPLPGESTDQSTEGSTDQSAGGSTDQSTEGGTSDSSTIESE